MARDINIVKANISTMLRKITPENTQKVKADIDKYIASEGYTKEMLQQGNVGPVVEPVSEPKSFDGFMDNAGTSLKQNLWDMPVQAISHPIDTITGIFKLGAGAVESIPGIKQILGDSPNQDAIKQLGTFIKDRYGSLDAAKETAYKDPVGFAMDLSTILGGVGGAAKVIGLSKVARGLKGAASVINPIEQGIKLTGKAITGTTNIAQKVAAPFAKTYQPKLAKMFESVGIQPTAGVVNTSYVPKALEALTTRGWFGGKLNAKMADMGNKLNEIADDVIKSIGVSPEPLNTGKIVTNAFENARNKFFTTKDELYAQANVYDLKVPIDMPETKSFVMQQLNLAKKSKITPSQMKVLTELKNEMFPTAKNAETLARQMLDDSMGAGTFDALPPNAKTQYMNQFAGKVAPVGKTTIAEAAATLKTINEKLKNVGGVAIESGERAVLSKIAASLSQEIDTTLEAVRPDLKIALDTANKYFSETKDKLNKIFGKSVKFHLENGDYDKVAKSLLNSNISILDIPKIYETLGAEATTALQAHVVDDIFKSARGTKNTFTGVDIQRQLNKYSIPKLREIFVDKPQVVDSIIDLQKMGTAISNGKWIANGSQTAFLFKKYQELGLLFTNHMLAAQVILGDYMFSIFVSSPMGQRWMKAGYKLPPTLMSAGTKVSGVAKPTAKMGTKLSQTGKYITPQGK